MLAKTIVDSTCIVDINRDLLKRLEEKIVGLVCDETIETPKTSPHHASNAAQYHLRSGGKRTRGRLAIHASQALGLSQNDALCLACAAELLHNASLIHDDLQDGDRLRHGLPTVWSKFGTNAAICTGDLMMSAAYAALCGVSNYMVIPSLVALVHARTLQAIRGQCEDLDVQNQAVNEIRMYEKIVIAKSGALLSLPLELALIASGHSNSAGQARRAAEAFSVAYQVADDLDDLPDDAQKGSLNIVCVAKASGVYRDAVASAKNFGALHLDEAIKIAHGLPLHSGALLHQLACELREYFSSKEL
jgi:geranylgeranyl pyrophosphate synthase